MRLYLGQMLTLRRWRRKRSYGEYLRGNSWAGICRILDQVTSDRYHDDFKGENHREAGFVGRTGCGFENGCLAEVGKADPEPDV